MLTPRQEDLVRRFYVGISILEKVGERYDAAKAKWFLHKCITNDDAFNACNAEILRDEGEADLVKKQHFVFEQLLRYRERAEFSKRLSYVVALSAFIFAIYQFHEAGWVWGLGTLVLVPILTFVSLPLFLAVFTFGFSPLMLRLTHTECQFALDEIVGHSRWNE